jgi:hypothetical protein
MKKTYMNVVLVSVGNFQQYMLININQLIRLGHSSIYVITNRSFEHEFSAFAGRIKLIFVEDLKSNFQYDTQCRLPDTQFRGGFWKYTSSRLFHIYDFMKQYEVTNVIHLENDSLIYYNVETLNGLFEPTHIYLPFDTFRRNIASIMYIPTAEVFGHALRHYNVYKNDMENFALIQEKTGLIRNLPICFTDTTKSAEYQFVTRGFYRFGYIFDAAAIGQYLGGVDPRNIHGDTRGFVNETCVIQFNQFSFEWTEINGIRRPFLLAHNERYPIFNLHIHSKRLEDFI